MSNDLAFLAGIIGIISIIVGIVVLACKSDSLKYDKMQKDDEQWLANEMKKPKWRIEFITSDGKHHYSKEADPYNSLAGSEWNFRHTSKYLASRWLEGAYSRGYFVDGDNTTYPTCNITSAQISEVKNVKISGT